jgi:hypothetical protein
MSWLKYLQETLGVRSVLWPEASTALTPASALAPQNKTALVVFVDSHPWSRQESELFEKMRAAMKLSREQTKLLFTTAEEIPQKSVELLAATCVIFFAPELAAQTGPLDDEVMRMTTFGPRELLANPQLKKQTWDDLQKVMKKLK